MAIRVLKTSFSASKEGIDKLFACNRISAMIWNDVLKIAKEFSLANDGKWIGQTCLQKQIKNKYPMHSQSVQSVTHRYLFARDAAHAAILKGFKNKYPWRRKKNYNTKWVDQAFEFDFVKNSLKLSLGIWNHKRQKPIIVKLPSNVMEKLISVEEKFGCDAISEIELCYDNGLMLCITYNDGLEVPQNIGFTETVGVDLGEIHSISACATNGNSVIITGRKLRSINRLRNKTLASVSKA